MVFVDQWTAAEHDVFRQRIFVAMVAVAKEVQGEHRIAPADQIVLTNITNADPAQGSSVAHGLTQGTEILVMDALGLTELNGKRWLVGFTSADLFGIRNLDNTDVDSTLFAVYAAGGVVGSTFKTKKQHDKRAILAAEVMAPHSFTGGTLVAMGFSQLLDTFVLAVASNPAIGDVDQTASPTSDADIKAEVAAVFDDIATVNGDDLL